jgi:ornithine cyclodeaminase/alanine dehydrogenase
MLILTGKDIEALAEIKDVIDAVENAFLELAKQTAICPKRLCIPIERHKGFAFFMPAYLSKMGALGTKIVTQYEENLQYGLPTVLASIILNNPKTGEILALMEGTYVTALRTGAASGIASKYLARKDSRVVSVIGTGVQARTQLWAVCEVLRNVEEVKVYDLFFERAEKFAHYISEKLKLDIKAIKTSRECIENSDVIITATTSKIPVLDGDWVKSGAHINSIGWMGPDARELDSKIIKRAKVVVDTKEGVLAESGDLIIPIKEGTISKDHIYAELAEIVSGKKPGRAKHEEITCFKSVGLAIEDAATAKLIYEKALKEGVGTRIEL